MRFRFFYQSYLLASINLAAGSSSLPHQIAVLSSSDGTSFNPSVYYVDVLSRCPSFTTAVQSNVSKVRRPPRVLTSVYHVIQVAANEAAGAILCLAYSGDEVSDARVCVSMNMWCMCVHVCVCLHSFICSLTCS